MKAYDFKTDVCIIGAGPAGALLAYLLSSHNISVILVERNGDINKEFRGEHLNDTGEAILRKYKLFDELEDVGLLRMERVEYWDHGEVFKTIMPDERVNHCGIHVPQKHLLGLLLKKSEPLPPFNLLLNTRVVELLEEDGQYSGVKAVKDGQEITIKSSLIVGADGRFSTIRKLADIPFEKIKHGYDLLWARIPAPKDWEPTVRMAMINGEQLALFTQQGGYIQIGWNIKEGSYPKLRKQPITKFVNQLIEAFPQLKDTVHAALQSWDDFVLLQVQSSKCETWVKNNLVIIGDAAHTMSPTGAIGINSAMKDADILFQIMMDASSINQVGRIDFEVFEQIRRNEVEQQQKEQLMKEESFGNQFIPV